MKELEGWVRRKHAGQLVKKTNLPYYHHLEFVARLASKYTPLGYPVGLCHDLLEKTGTTPDELHSELVQLQINDADTIVAQVIELTDVYTRTAYPGWPKAKRKAMEEERLANISPGAQVVKYADLTYNMRWMQQYEPEKYPDYAARKLRFLKRMEAVKFLI